MNKSAQFILKVLKEKVYPKIGTPRQFPPLVYEKDQYKCRDVMNSVFERKEPCMVTRYGATELRVVLNYWGTLEKKHSYIKYIKGEQFAWWWQWGVLNQVKMWSGFFPTEPEYLERYAKLMMDDSQYIDVLGCMAPQEPLMKPYLKRDVERIRLRYIEPDFFAYDASKEWTQHLKGKKVLIIHPFTETIKKQYAKREKLFRDKNLLPEFELLTIKAVQSLGGECEYSSWFEALDWMKSEMDKLDYDVAIIGCGAYGLHLAAHAKRTGHIGIHMGGATQLLFGIIGKRWEDRDDYSQLINEYWCHPDGSEIPAVASKVEGGCYW